MKNRKFSAVLIGGMDRLQPQYVAAAERKGCELSCISRNRHGFVDRIGRPDAMIIFTNKISHEAKDKAARLAKALGIPVVMSHSCGLSSLGKCVDDAMALA